MGRSNESQKRIKIVSAEIVKETKAHELKASKAKAAQKLLPEYGKEMPEGEISIPLGNFKAQRDDNGKIVNVKFLGKTAKKAEKEMGE